MHTLSLRLLLPAAALAAALAACDNGTPPIPGAKPSASAPEAPASAGGSASAAHPAAAPAQPRREGSIIARALDEDALYVADEDHKVLRRVALPLDQTKNVAAALPGAPAQLVALAGKVLVTIRDPGMLLVLKPDAEKGFVETARVALPADAWGVTVTPDEKTALVTSAWTHKLSAIDLGTSTVKWTIDVAREPRAVLVHPDGQAYVTHLVGPGITRVDDLAGTPKIKTVELPPAPARSPSGKTVDASLAYSAVFDEGYKRLFVARHALGALGQGSWYGATTVDVMATANDAPVLAKRIPGLPMARHSLIVQMIDNGLVTNVDTAGQDITPIIQPRASILRKSTHTILVAGEGDDRVAEVDALSVAPMLEPLAVYKVGSSYDVHLPVAGVCGAPSGLALSTDEKKLYVFCRSTYDIAEVDLLEPEKMKVTAPTSNTMGTPAVTAKIATIHLADDPLGKEEALGRRFFYNATDPMVSGGLACNGCHPEGRDDGHVWHEAKVMSLNESERNIFIGEPEDAPNMKEGKIGYARQTPMLAGRLGFKGPYGWHAQNADLVERLKEGFGLHRWTSQYPKGVGETLARIQYIRAYALKGLVNPPRADHEPTPEEKRGKDIFMSNEAKCSRCHVPETEYTDRIAYPLQPKLAPTAGFEDDPRSEYKTPSLRFVVGTAPYFHDGRYKTLEELIDQNNDRMGHTSHLSPDDRKALIAFLRTL